VQKNTPQHVQMRLDRCIWCNKPLPQGRYDRKSHEGCRQKIYKYKRRSEILSNACIKQLNEIETRLNYEFSFSDGIASLVAVQKEINEIYKRHNIVKVK